MWTCPITREHPRIFTAISPVEARILTPAWHAPRPPSNPANRRYKYLCPKDFNEDFHFGCSPKQTFLKKFSSKQTTSWYTVCGKAHADNLYYLKYLAVVVALGTMAALSLWVMLLGSARHEEPQRTNYSKGSRSTQAQRPPLMSSPTRRVASSPVRASRSPTGRVSPAKSPRSARKATPSKSKRV
jgi:hypothetical protein